MYHWKPFASQLGNQHVTWETVIFSAFRDTLRIILCLLNRQRGNREIRNKESAENRKQWNYKSKRRRQQKKLLRMFESFHILTGIVGRNSCPKPARFCLWIEKSELFAFTSFLYWPQTTLKSKDSLTCLALLQPSWPFAEQYVYGDSIFLQKLPHKSHPWGAKWYSWNIQQPPALGTWGKESVKKHIN